MTVIAWVRRSLREHDNTSIRKASESSEEVVPFYCVDKKYFSEADLGFPRVKFWRDSLVEFKENLEEQKGKKMVLRHGKPVEELKKLVEESGADKIVVNQDYTPYFRDLLRDVRKSLDVKVETVKDIVMFEKEEITTNKGKPYKVYTYFMKKWFKNQKRRPEKVKKYVVPELGSDKIPSLRELGFDKPEKIDWAWNPGRKGGIERLEKFKDKIGFYGEKRDFPSKEGTSKLSPHLKFGTVSIREVFWEMERLREKNPSYDEGVRVWQEELAWRDFYFQVLWNWPETVEKAFIEDFRGINWVDDKEKFKRWAEGKTGFPFIDAGMRELEKTGWMHNRARMAVTSFACKDLWLDWKKVHRFFSRKFVDAELSSMIGGVQWAYSIGTDAQPFFRVFNPWTQGEKYDPDGTYIRKFIPELEEVPDKYIHRPYKMSEETQKSSKCILGDDYPYPIVDHDEKRKESIEKFRKIKE